MRRDAPTAILTGDIHLRDDQPLCRTDDYLATQARKMQWLCELQDKYSCPVLDAGDLFNKSKPRLSLIQWAITHTPMMFFTVPGNHDLPSHNLELLDNSGLGILNAACSVQCLLNPIVDTNMEIHPFPWGVDPHPIEAATNAFPTVALCHTMTYDGKSPWPGCTDPTATQLLRRMKGYDLVVTGHNHKAFVVERHGRLLVNPGSLMRANADQIDFKPRVYLWYADENRVEPVYVPIEEGVINRDHIDKVADRDERIDAFVDKLSVDCEIGLSFEKNLEEFFSRNRIRTSVKNIVWSAVKGE